MAFEDLTVVALDESEKQRREDFMRAYQEGPFYKKAALTRLKIADTANHSSDARVFALGASKKDPKFFITNFLWTPNDKYSQYHFPFILFPFQEEYVDWLCKHIDEGRDGLVEKSREMGVTWVTLAVFYWYWLFSPNFNALVGSYKKELVDDRTKDSLFGMLDYFIEITPAWMLPKGFNFDKHRTQMKLVNPVTHNVIKGDTMNAEFGRGSRRTVIFMDEGAHWEYFQEAWDSAADTTSCRITISTPLGYNAFALLRESNQIDVERLQWQLHPLKDDTWYNYEKSRRTDENVAQELDISYEKSQKGRIYPEWDNVVRGEFPYDPSLPLYVAWDFGRTDDTAIIWAQIRADGKVVIIDAYSNSGHLIDFYVPFITGVVDSELMVTNGYHYTDRELQMIEEHKFWPRGVHFGDPAGRFRNQVSDKTVISVLRDNGIIVNYKDSWKVFETRTSTAKLLMRDNLWLNENPQTKKLHLAIVNSKYPDVKRGGMDIINSQGRKPRHDANSHFRSSLEYLCLGLKDLKVRNKTTYDKFKRKNSPTGLKRQQVAGGRRVIGY